MEEKKGKRKGKAKKVAEEEAMIFGMSTLGQDGVF